MSVALAADELGKNRREESDQKIFRAILQQSMKRKNVSTKMITM